MARSKEAEKSGLLMRIREEPGRSGKQGQSISSRFWQGIDINVCFGWSLIPQMTKFVAAEIALDSELYRVFKHKEMPMSVLQDISLLQWRRLKLLSVFGLGERLM